MTMFSPTSRPMSEDKLLALNVKVDQTKTIVRGNVDKMIDSIEKLDRMEVKAKEVKIAAGHFQRKANEVRCKQCRAYWKPWAVAFVLLAAAAILIGVVASRK
jgi:hypothetical protein